MATATATKEKMKLTTLKCGDQDNKAWFGSYSENPDDAEKVLAMLTAAPNGMDEIESIIFNDDISADGYRKILKALTVFEEYGKRTGDSGSTWNKAQILFFATLVNYNGTISKAVPGLKSYQAAREAANSAKAEGRELDYREYIISGNNSNWNNEYKTIVTTNKDYSVKIQVQLPIVKLKLGLWRFATERIPGIMELVGDPDNTKLLVPATTWMRMIEEAMGKRITTKFTKFDEKSLSKIVKVDADMIDDILAQNNFKSVIHFINEYDMSINENNELVLHNTNEPPEFTTSGFSWNDTGHDDWVLNCDEFYLVKMTGNTVHVLQTR